MVVRSSFSESLGPRVIDFAKGLLGLKLESVSHRHMHRRCHCAHLFFEPAPTPAPLLETDTVASSKPHEDAADTIDAPERRREGTTLKNLMMAGWEKSGR
jgi:hypothetical protein